MSRASDIISLAAVELARQVPEPTLRLLARAIELSGPAAADVNPALILQSIAQADHRALASELVRVWLTQVPEIVPAAVSLAILTAARSRHLHAADEQVELVWTGPHAGEIPLRRTEQAVLQVLDSAINRITLVSYAVYRIPNICAALVRAARRGVRIRVVVETPDQIEGQNAYDTLRALGSEVAACAAVYYWPLAKRPTNANGKPAILHVKCAVADAKWLFLSSANLTEYAFTINTELGVLITGGTSPKSVEAQFDRLVGDGVWEPIRGR